MEIDLETLIVSVDCLSNIVEDADDMDTGTIDGSGSIEVRAASVAMTSERSYVFAGVSIEVSGDRMNWEQRAIVEEAAQMLVKDYLEPKDENENDETVLLGHMAG